MLQKRKAAKKHHPRLLLLFTIVQITNLFACLVWPTVFALKKAWNYHRRVVRHWNSMALLETHENRVKHSYSSWGGILSLAETLTFPGSFLTNRSQKTKMVIYSLASVQGRNDTSTENKIRIVPKLVCGHKLCPF